MQTDRCEKRRARRTRCEVVVARESVDEDDRRRRRGLLVLTVRVVGLESWTWTQVGLESDFLRTWTGLGLEGQGLGLGLGLER